MKTGHALLVAFFAFAATSPALAEDEKPELFVGIKGHIEGYHTIELEALERALEKKLVIDNAVIDKVTIRNIVYSSYQNQYSHIDLDISLDSSERYSFNKCPMILEYRQEPRNRRGTIFTFSSCTGRLTHSKDYVLGDAEIGHFTIDRDDLPTREKAIFRGKKD